jgi:capsule polysaccharide export protein KpsE/RkpR
VKQSITKTTHIALFVLTFFTAAAFVKAQTASTGAASNASTELIAATKEYKASSTELLAMREQELAKAVATLEELKPLVADGLVAKAALETEEQNVAALRARFEATQKQIADSDNRISQIKSEAELAQKRAASPVKLVAKSYLPLNTSATILRSSGAGSWSLGGLGDVQSSSLRVLDDPCQPAQSVSRERTTGLTTTTVMRSMSHCIRIVQREGR